MSNICEHDYLRRKCPFCEIAQLERENEQLRAELDRLKRGGWVSVKERLPENGQRVLVYYRIGETCDITETRYVAGRYIGYWGGGVTHWMPLPEPPEEG
jgi:Protein of unknown function (DUF551).